MWRKRTLLVVLAVITITGLYVPAEKIQGTEKLTPKTIQGDNCPTEQTLPTTNVVDTSDPLFLSLTSLLWDAQKTYGTAFIVRENGIRMATIKHIADLAAECGYLYMRALDAVGRLKPSKFTSFSGGSDPIMIYSFSESTAQKLQQLVDDGKMKILSFEHRTPHLGDTVFVPKYDTGAYSGFRISKIEGDSIWMESEKSFVCQGNSGSPVIFAKSKNEFVIIGVLSSIPTDELFYLHRSTGAVKCSHYALFTRVS